MPIQLDMHKSAETIRLNLTKHGIMTPPVIDVAFDLDVSQSYEDEHNNGSTNGLMARLVPWGLVFDPDKKLDVFTFSSGKEGAHYVGEVNERNYQGFVRREVIKKVPGWNGGTNFSHVLRKNLQHFGWLKQDPVEAQPVHTGGVLSGLKRWAFGAPAATPGQSAVLERPRKSLVLLNTDGETQDESATTRLLEEMQVNGYAMYVLFIAYANKDASGRAPDFSYIEGLADRFDNTGIHVVHSIDEFVNASDEQINKWLIKPELVKWLKK